MTDAQILSIQVGKPQRMGTPGAADTHDQEWESGIFKEQKVEVAAVNVVNVKGKEKRHGRFEGRRRDVKKAYVSLKGEGDINFVEGVA